MHRYRPAILAIGVLSVVAAVATAVYEHARSDGDISMHAISTLGFRAVEPRLSGPWRYAPPRRSDTPWSSPSELRHLRGAAANFLLDRNEDAQPDRRATAIAYLIGGESARAVADLRAVAESSLDAQVWSDLSAALLVRAEHVDDGDLVVDALAAADRSIALDSRLPHAHFNRALSLERLGLLRDARREWGAYLQTDRSSQWSDEAFRRLSALKLSSEADETRRLFKQLRSEARLPDPAIRDLVRRYPQFSRRAAESDVLPDWAATTLGGDAEAARRHLEFARSVGRHLDDFSGEGLLAESVSAIDRAMAEGSVERLARAYVLYREGRRLHSDSQAIAAERKLREAASLFERASSPMAYVARYYVGSSLHAQLRLVEASVLLDALQMELRENPRFRALAAQTGWERGACSLERGAISEAIDIFSRSREGFERLAERDSAASMDGFLAVSLDFAGDSAGAWRARRRALEALTRSGNDERALIILQAAATSATLVHQWTRARALLDLTVPAAERMELPLVAAHAFTQRAVVRFRQGDGNGAHRDIESARRWSTRLPDQSIRSRADADLAFADAILRSNSNPQNALGLFDEAVQFYDRADRHVEISRIHLERARTARRLGRVGEARRDVEAGISVVARERSALRDLEQRASLLAAAEELFEEAIALAIIDNDPEEAFRLSETRSARMLMDRFELGAEASNGEIEPMPLGRIRATLSPGAAIVAYASLPDRLIAFVVRRDSFAAYSTNVRRDALRTATSDLFDAIDQNTNDLLAKSAAAEDLLLGNVRTALIGAQHIAFVTDRHTSGVPFCALYDPVTRQFLIERAAVNTAPSVTLLINASRRSSRLNRESLLAVGANVFDTGIYQNLDALPQAAAEAAEVAGMYRRAKLVTGRDATLDIARQLGSYEVVHFAGHGITNRDRIGQSALLLAPAAENHGELRLHDIARQRMRETHLVVLAACGSAREVSRGDGAENLALGFIAAGVPSVVASLWELEDEVSLTLMTDFHRRLRQGEEPARALQTVIRQHLRDKDHRIRTPLNWASIVFMGGSSELIERGATP